MSPRTLAGLRRIERYTTRLRAVARDRGIRTLRASDYYRPTDLVRVYRFERSSIGASNDR